MTSVGCCMTLLFKAGNVLVDEKGAMLQATRWVSRERGERRNLEGSSLESHTLLSGGAVWWKGRKNLLVDVSLSYGIR